MRNYDFEKAKRLIDENKTTLVEASLGMHEDWFWTAETIWKDGVFTKELPTDIMGITGSSWATPTIHLQFTNDADDKMIPCFEG